MSQENEVCVKCGVKAGYDDDKVNWNEHNKVLCGRCKINLISRFSAFFDLHGGSYSSVGLEIEWPEVDKILSSIRKDELMRVRYLVTDREFYRRTVDIDTPIEQGI